MKGKIHSRLFHFTAPGGKARIIANVDWLSQTALSSIHFTLFKILTEISADRTFDHKSGMDIFDNTAESYYSIDLSAATDRMPRLLQSKILEVLYNLLHKDGKLISECWLDIVDREYSTLNSPINNNENIRYSVGQGMGLFTSWPIMSLTHHYIVNSLCKIPKEDYRIVGDDLIIRNNEDGYKKYLYIMDRIGLTVNPDKTIVSYNKNRHNLEFARNYIIRGVKINPYPFGMLFAWYDNKLSFSTLIWFLSEVLEEDQYAYYINELYIPQARGSDLNILLYYLFRENKIIIESLKQKIKVSLPTWFNDTYLNKIIDITSEERVETISKFNKYETYSKQFIDTFKSQCTVRNQNELEKNRELINSIELLTYLDSEIAHMAIVIMNRLHSTDIIKYEYDLDSCPKVSNREINLLKDLSKVSLNQLIKSEII